MEQFYSLISAFIIILSGLLLIYIMTAIIISIRQNKKNKNIIKYYKNLIEKPMQLTISSRHGVILDREDTQYKFEETSISIYVCIHLRNETTLIFDSNIFNPIEYFYYKKFIRIYKNIKSLLRNGGTINYIFIEKGGVTSQVGVIARKQKFKFLK